MPGPNWHFKYFLSSGSRVNYRGYNIRPHPDEAANDLGLASGRCGEVGIRVTADSLIPQCNPLQLAIVIDIDKGPKFGLAHAAPRR